MSHTSLRMPDSLRACTVGSHNLMHGLRLPALIRHYVVATR